MSIEAIVGAALTIGGALVGLAVAWGRLGNRVVQLEKDAAKFEALATKVTEIDSKVETARKDQGYRLGNLEADTAVLKGEFKGFQSGFGAGRRSRTAAHGMPTMTGMPRAGDFGDKGDK